MNYYVPNAGELLEMSLAHFEQHAEELRSKFERMTPAQQKALVDVCRHIAEMKNVEPVR